MIITRTPLRVSLFGGGTDYPEWFNENGGAVLGLAIDKYCWVTLRNGEVGKHFDLPTKSGLGSSSAFTVGLLRACTKSDGLTLAKLAIQWERDKMNGNIGCQDQYLCALGGVLHIEFNDQWVNIKRMDEKATDLVSNLMLFDTGIRRLAGNVVEEQLENIRQNKDILHAIYKLVNEGIKALGDDDFGRLLNEEWQLKRELSKHVSTREIDQIYGKAIQAGALGGKLLGAGGGGFMIFYVKPDKQEEIKQVLEDLRYVPFKCTETGSQIIYEDSSEDMG